MSLVESLELSALRGRKSKLLTADYVRDVRESDLALLSSERAVQPISIAKLRDRHHALARCLAQGMTNAEASLVTGYDPSRVSVLRGDPAFKQLVADYSKVEDGLQAEFQSRAATLTLTAMNEIQDRLEDEEQVAEVSINTLLEIGKFGADRTGSGPQTKSQNVSVNIDLSTRLREARLRLVNNLDHPIEGQVIDPS